MAKVEIDKEKCKGCNYCLIACPKNVLAVSDAINTYGVKPVIVIDMDACSGCTLCAQICPETCIEIWK